MEVEQTVLNSKLTRDELQALYANPVLESYKALLEDGTLSDVVFVVGDREFRLHKPIFAAQSPVFATMFEIEAKHQIEARVEVPDISVASFEELLRFFYLGKIPDVNKFGPELFSFANKVFLTRSFHSKNSKFLTINSIFYSIKSSISNHFVSSS